MNRETQGAANAIGEMEACIPALRRYAFALLRRHQDADDLVHDVLVRALDNLHTRHDGAGMRPWLFTIMHNLFISQMRRAKVRRDAPPPPAELIPGPQEGSHRFRDMLRGLDTLPEDQRQVLLLVSVEDLSYAEAAGVLGVPIGTVMSRLSRAREKLRQATDEGVRPALRRVK